MTNPAATAQSCIIRKRSQGEAQERLKMSVRVKLHPILKQLAGGQEALEVTCRTTGECLENLESRFPDIKKMIRDDRGRLRRYCQISVNSRPTYPDELTTTVKDGDQVEIDVLVAGG